MKMRGLYKTFGRACIVLLFVAVGLAGFASTGMAREPYEIELYTIPAGFPPYAISVGVAEIINKNSTWLRATALEGRGPVEAMKFVVTDPKKRTNFFFFNQPKWVWSASEGMGAFKKHPYDYKGKIKSVALLGAAASTLATLNKKIKALKDFEGKKVAVDSGPGRTRQLLYEDMFRQAGVDPDKIKFEFMRGNASANAMRDGLIDGCYIAWDLVEPPNVWRANSWTTELMTTKDVYMIPIPRQYYENYKKRTGFLGNFIEFPPQFFSKLQTQPAGCFVSCHSWNCHADMPDDVVYEFCRIIYENAEKLKDYSPFGAIITKETMATMNVSEKMIHPAALKFYKEKGVPIGSFH